MQNYKSRLIFKFLIVIFTFSFFIFNLGKVVAQEITLSISPPLLETVIKPGKSIMIAYRLDNLGDPTILKTKVLPFLPFGNTGHIQIKDEFEGPIRFFLDNSLIKLGDPFFLKSRDSQQLLLRIQVPEGTPEGDYYYTLLAETEAPQSIEGATTSQAKAVIGSNILITVTQSGNIDVKGKITIFDILPRFKFNLFGRAIKIFDSNDRIPIILIIENRGKNMIKPYGQINLIGNFGEKAVYEIIPQNILAESQRIISASPSALIESKQPMSLVISGFFVGRYKLSAAVNFGEENRQVFASVSFLAVPFKLIFGFITSVFVAILIIKKISENNES